MNNQQRPIFLDVPKLGSKMSITAKISILHRISGVLMFLAIPFVLCLFHRSLTSPEFYQSAYHVTKFPIMKLIYWVLLWSIMHHMCAGIRFLFLDTHVGIGRNTAKKTAYWVIVVSLLLTVLLGILTW